MLKENEQLQWHQGQGRADWAGRTNTGGRAARGSGWHQEAAPAASRKDAYNNDCDSKVNLCIRVRVLRVRLFVCVYVCVFVCVCVRVRSRAQSLFVRSFVPLCIRVCFVSVSLHHIVKEHIGNQFSPSKHVSRRRLRFPNKQTISHSNECRRPSVIHNVAAWLWEQN